MNKDKVKEKQRLQKYKNSEKGKAQSKKYYQDNKDKIKEYQKEYNSRPEVRERKKAYKIKYDQCHKEELKAQHKEYHSRPEVKERHKEWQKNYFLTHKEERYKSRRKYVKSVWKQIFDMYGWECACCGEDNPAFLTVDHVNGRGREDRKGNGSGTPYLNRIIKEHDNTKYQILCWNCNCARTYRGKDGNCPHKIIEKWLDELEEEFK
jgi:hypothetical protein